MRLLANKSEVPLFELTQEFEIGRTAVSKHLTILKDAGLVTSKKVGRETRYILNSEPLKEVKSWIAFYEDFWSERLVRLDELLKKQLEE